MLRFLILLNVSVLTVSLPSCGSSASSNSTRGVGGGETAGMVGGTVAPQTQNPVITREPDGEPLQPQPAPPVPLADFANMDAKTLVS